MKIKKLFIKNIKKIIWIIISVVVIVSFVGCMSLVMGYTKSLYKDYGVYDKSVPNEQMCEFRILNVFIKSFNGNSVSWGKIPSWENTTASHGTGKALGSFGYIRIPAGTNSFIFDWVETIKEETRTETRGSSSGGSYTIITHYQITTESSRNNTFSNIEMLPGHKYYISGSKGNDGKLRFWLEDCTSTPSGFFGDKVPRAPKENLKNSTKFDGTWFNNYGESIKFTGNTWLQRLPPYCGQNTGPDELRMFGTFQFTDEKITLFFNGVEYTGPARDAPPKWALKMANDAIKAQEQIFIYKYYFDGNKILLELPWMLPEIAYTKY